MITEYIQHTGERKSVTSCREQLAPSLRFRIDMRAVVLDKECGRAYNATSLQSRSVQTSGHRLIRREL